MSSTDRIEKKILLRAPLKKVWNAFADAKAFGQWFRVKMDAPFAVGATVQGQVLIPGYEHKILKATVERMEPERLLTWRWHPNAGDPNVDYDQEPTTLVEIHFEEKEGGTLVTVIESGFDALPAERQKSAFRANDGGWAAQLENLQRHVS